MPKMSLVKKGTKRIKLEDGASNHLEPASKACIDHRKDINSTIGSLLTDDDLADITFVVKGVPIKCHKIILGSRSHYFRALLYGGLRETNMNKIDLLEVDPDSFKLILKYIYTGQVYLDDIPEETIFPLIQLSSCYCLDQFTSSLIDLLTNNLTTQVAIGAYELGKLCDLPKLTKAALNYIDQHANQVLTHPSLISLPPNLILELLTRDTLYAKEINIFRAIERYCTENCLEAVEARNLIEKCVRFSLIPNNLMDYIKISPYFSGELYTNIVTKRKEKSWKKVKNRGRLIPDTNFCLNVEGFKVIKGKPQLICDFASIVITEEAKQRGEKAYVEFKMGDKFFINHIEMLAYIEPCRDRLDSNGRIIERKVITRSSEDIKNLQTGHEIAYAYEAYLSVDGSNWRKVTDNNGCYIFSWQCPYFKPTVAQFIRIEITDIQHCPNAILHLLHFRAFHSSCPMSFTKDKKLIPYMNVAKTPKLPETWPGSYPSFIWALQEFRNEEAMYKFSSIHRLTDAELGPDDLTFTLPQDCLIDTIKFLLYDKDDRTYDYTVRIGLKLSCLAQVADLRDEKSWQTIKFEPTLVRYIKIQGKAIHNITETDGFRLYNLSVYHTSPLEPSSFDESSLGGHLNNSPSSCDEKQPIAGGSNCKEESTWW